MTPLSKSPDPLTHAEFFQVPGQKAFLAVVGRDDLSSKTTAVQSSGFNDLGDQDCEAYGILNFHGRYRIPQP